MMYGLLSLFLGSVFIGGACTALRHKSTQSLVAQILFSMGVFFIALGVVLMEKQ